MKILIIGGTGLISTYITQQILDRGDLSAQVTLYNRGMSRYPTPPGVTVIHGDRTDYPAFEAQIASAGRFDAVIDMVGYAPADGDSVVRAFSGRIGQLIFCSTVDVYLKPASRYPYTEAEGYGGLNEYASNKVILEKTLIDASRSGAYSLTIIRPAYTYGEGRGPLHTLGGGTGYIDRLRRGLPIVVHGDGSSLWVACHASDVARTFVNALGNYTAHNQAYHAAGEEWLTWNNYHQQAAEALGAPPPTLVHIPTEVLARLAPQRGSLALTNIQFNNIFENAAAKRDLGFTYTIPWKDGVRRMANWLDERGMVDRAEKDPFEDRLIDWWLRHTGGLTNQPVNLEGE